jgi:hypothetical protein
MNWMDGMLGKQRPDCDDTVGELPETRLDIPWGLHWTCLGGCTGA